tara:strand:+ start:695 stop:1000 length:306 start_codon:yes stop_codon:yes gene_type:complete
MKKFKGKCLCGEVKYTALDCIDKENCKCNKCQKSSGSLSIKWFSTSRNTFILDDKKSLYRQYKSSKYAKRGFCSKCGSNLTMDYGKKSQPNTIWVTTLTLK